MSLINDMLRDVKQRYPEKKKTDRGAQSKLEAVASGFGALFQKKHYWGVGCAGVLLAGFLHITVFHQADFVRNMMDNDPFYTVGMNLYDRAYGLFTPTAHFESLAATSELEEMDLSTKNKTLLSDIAQEDSFQPAPSKVLYFTHQVLDTLFQKDPVQGLDTILAVQETESLIEPPAPSAPMLNKDPENRVNAKNTMKKTERTEQHAADVALSQAAAFVQAGHPEAARNTLQAALQAQPLDHEIRAALADLYLESKNLLVAEKLARAGLDLVPDQPALVRVLARIQAAQGRYESAITLLLNSPPILRDQPEHYSLLAALYQKEGRYDLASQIYMDLVHFFPQNGRWWTGLGIALEETQNPQAALDSYVRSLSIANLDPSLRSFALERIDGLSKEKGIMMNGGSMMQSDTIGAR